MVLFLGLFCSSALLLFCSSALLLFCSSALLLFCSSALLLFCSSALLLKRYFVTLILSTAHLLICSFAHLLICSFAHLLICSFAHLLICSFAHLLICSFAHLLKNSPRLSICQGLFPLLLRSSPPGKVPACGHRDRSGSAGQIFLLFCSFVLRLLCYFATLLLFNHLLHSKLYPTAPVLVNRA